MAFTRHTQTQRAITLLMILLNHASHHSTSTVLVQCCNYIQHSIPTNITQYIILHQVRKAYRATITNSSEIELYYNNLNCVFAAEICSVWIAWIVAKIIFSRMLMWFVVSYINWYMVYNNLYKLMLTFNYNNYCNLLKVKEKKLQP